MWRRGSGPSERVERRVAFSGAACGVVRALAILAAGAAVRGMVASVPPIASRSFDAPYFKFRFELSYDRCSPRNHASGASGMDSPHSRPALAVAAVVVLALAAGGWWWHAQRESRKDPDR